MGRALLIAEFFINISFKNDKSAVEKGAPATVEKLVPLYVSTCHFESLESDIFRENRSFQLKDTLDVIFKKERACVIVGDFNFDNQHEYENNVSKYGFRDVIKQFQAEPLINN